MKTKEEILDHLSKTVYTHNARRSIVEWMLQHNIVKNKGEIKFLGHAYDYNGVRLTKGNSFMNFISFALFDITEDTASALNKILCEMHERFSDSYYVDPRSHRIRIESVITDFEVGDVVKYIPDPDNTSDEYVEAIANGSEGHVYLCLSNGEWVKPCYCVKYKYQGDERRALIDKLNEVL